MGKRNFGSLRKLPSGRYQVRYRGPDGVMRPAPMTFPTKASAERWLATVQTDITRGTWVDETLLAETVADFGDRWLNERAGLAPRTRKLYRGQWAKHIRPHVGSYRLGQMTPALVRSWHHQRKVEGVGASTVAKCYRLLRAIMATAVNDGLLSANPCRIPGADQERPEERPILSVQQVAALANAVPARFKALVLLSVFTSLRWGELAGLQRNDVDLDRGVISVRRTLSEDDGTLTFKEPKSQAGRRIVSLPEIAVVELRFHLETYCADKSQKWIFVGPRGGLLRRSNFNRWWSTARKTAGISPDVHFHDLRHTGNHWAASTGASTRELMARMGHSTMTAALMYQHATIERDRHIANGIDDMWDAQCGTRVAREGGLGDDAA